MDFLKKLQEMAMDDPPPKASGDGARAHGGKGFSDLLQTASSMLSSQQQEQHKPTPPAPHSDAPAAAVHHRTDYEEEDDEPSEGKSSSQVHAATKPGYGDLLSSAKLVLDAAQGKKGADKSELAAAAANILGAVSSYGKLEDKPYGNYIRKAQDYLQSYEGKQAGVSSLDASDPPASSASVHSAPHAVPDHIPSAKPCKSQSPHESSALSADKPQVVSHHPSVPQSAHESVSADSNPPVRPRPHSSYDSPHEYPSADEELGSRPGLGQRPPPRPTHRPQSVYDSADYSSVDDYGYGGYRSEVKHPSDRYSHEGPPFVQRPHSSSYGSVDGEYPYDDTYPPSQHGPQQPGYGSRPGLGQRPPPQPTHRPQSVYDSADYSSVDGYGFGGYPYEVKHPSHGYSHEGPPFVQRPLSSSHGSVDEEYPYDDAYLPSEHGPQQPGYGRGNPQATAHRPPYSVNAFADDDEYASAYTSYDSAQHGRGHGYGQAPPPPSAQRPSSDEFLSHEHYSSTGYGPRPSYGHRPTPPYEDGPHSYSYD